jgi:uncharacterized protein (DUF1778 family)
LAVRLPYTHAGGQHDDRETTKRRRSQPLEIRITPEERVLIDRAVAAAGTDLTEFVVSNLKIAAQQVLADRTEFVLDRSALDRWEVVNDGPARHLPGVAALFARPTPILDE